MARELSQYVPRADTDPERKLALVLPHAGWVYSAAIAGETLAQVAVPDRVIVLCPNHTGVGKRRSLWHRGSWELPGGSVPVDEALADQLLALGFEADTQAHLREHAIEVQLPLLRARQTDLRVVPVCLGPIGLDECVELGSNLGRLLARVPDAKRPLLVASTDMSHFLSAHDAKQQDEHALDRIRALDPEGLYREVVSRDISMCGFIPTTLVLAACRVLGATRAQLVRYGTSGDVSGDSSRVVAYAGFTIS